MAVNTKRKFRGRSDEELHWILTLELRGVLKEDLLDLDETLPDIDRLASEILKYKWTHADHILRGADWFLSAFPSKAETARSIALAISIMNGKAFHLVTYVNDKPIQALIFGSYEDAYTHLLWLMRGDKKENFIWRPNALELTCIHPERPYSIRRQYLSPLAF